MLDAFTPPDAQDGIFPHLRGVGSFRMRLLLDLKGLGGGIRVRVQGRKGRKGGRAGGGVPDDGREEDKGGGGGMTTT